MNGSIRRLRYFLLIFAFWILLPTVSPAAELPFGKGLLWQVTAPKGQVSYVLGTVHSTDPRILDIPPPIQRAFEVSRRLAVEFVMTPQAQAQLMEASMINDGRSLDQILGPDLFRRSAIAARAYGLAPQQLRTFKPWGLWALFAVPPEEMLRGARGHQVLDAHLQTLAKQQGKSLHGLETPAEQIGVFESFTETEQIAILKSTLEEHDQIHMWFEKMLRAYLARDLEAIERMMMEQSTGIDPILIRAFAERLIDRRNRNMVERAEPLLQEGKAFIAVGALHLPGEKGILALLAQRGYQLARVY